MQMLKIAGVTCPIALDTIVWIQADNNYSRVHLISGEFYLITHTLNWFEERLPRFVRIHKSALIHPLHLKGFEQPSAKLAQVNLSTGVRLSVSRRRLAAVKTRLGLIPLVDYRSIVTFQ